MTYITYRTAAERKNKGNNVHHYTTILYALCNQIPDRSIKYEPNFSELKAFHAILHQQTYNTAVS
jgi:hypothetical protein